jgi:hypothetical protein
MFPHRCKLGRTSKKKLLEIHDKEEARFSHLRDYGQELRRSNPRSTFFMLTNSEVGSDVVKKHLDTLYWPYDACKRFF